MAYPTRHPNHILETECNKFVLGYIPNEWCCDKPEHDYGIDYTVNIAYNNQVVGLNFSVQLKSIHKTNSKENISITLKQTTLNFFNARLEPIMLIVYSQEDKEAYWLWCDDLTLDLTKNQKTYKIDISKRNKLSSISWSSIVDYIKNVFSVKLLIDCIRQLEYNELTNTEILAWKNYCQKDYESAIFYFKRSLKDKPQDLSLLEALAHSFYMNCKYNEALVTIDNLIAISGTEKQLLLKASILTEDGVKRRIKSRLLEAKRIFHDLIDQSINESTYHYNYANALSYLEEYDEAIKHYEICLSLTQNYAEAWKNLGGVYNKLQNHKEEIKCYDKALSINPLLSQALFSKGVTLSQIYKKHKDGLKLMESALSEENELINDFPHGYYWLAYANEKLGDLEKSYNWINKGLNIIPEDSYLLNFKCHFLSQYWTEANWIKNEAEFFFDVMVATYNDYRSLYYYITIKNIDDLTIIELIHKYIPKYRDISIQDIEQCFNVKEFIKILFHFHKYLKFRVNYSIDRYTSHLISGNFVIQAKFWDMLDLIFGYSFSIYIEQYEHNKVDKMDEVLLSRLSITPEAILHLVKSENFTKEEMAAIISEIYIGFTSIIIREFGIQKGYVEGSLGLSVDASQESSLPEQWYENLGLKTLEKSIIALGISK